MEDLKQEKIATHDINEDYIDDVVIAEEIPEQREGFALFNP